MGNRYAICWMVLGHARTTWDHSHFVANYRRIIKLYYVACCLWLPIYPVSNGHWVEWSIHFQHVCFICISTGPPHAENQSKARFGAMCSRTYFWSKSLQLSSNTLGKRSANAGCGSPWSSSSFRSMRHELAGSPNCWASVTFPQAIAKPNPASAIKAASLSVSLHLRPRMVSWPFSRFMTWRRHCSASPIKSGCPDNWPDTAAAAIRKLGMSASSTRPEAIALVNLATRTCISLGMEFTLTFRHGSTTTSIHCWRGGAGVPSHLNPVLTTCCNCPQFISNSSCIEDSWRAHKEPCFMSSMTFSTSASVWNSLALNNTAAKCFFPKRTHALTMEFPRTNFRHSSQICLLWLLQISSSCLHPLDLTSHSPEVASKE